VQPVWPLIEFPAQGLGVGKGPAADPVARFQDDGANPRRFEMPSRRNASKARSNNDHISISDGSSPSGKGAGRGNNASDDGAAIKRHDRNSLNAIFSSHLEIWNKSSTVKQLQLGAALQAMVA
jgi:hypothetical protein